MTRATMHRMAAELRDAGLSVTQARTLALRRRDTRMCYEIRPVRYYLRCQWGHCDSDMGAAQH